jgi:hypothetical protein
LEGGPRYRVTLNATDAPSARLRSGQAQLKVPRLSDEFPMEFNHCVRDDSSVVGFAAAENRALPVFARVIPAFESAVSTKKLLARRGRRV